MMFAVQKLKTQICPVEKYIMTLKKGACINSSLSKELENPVRKLFQCLVFIRSQRVFIYLWCKIAEDIMGTKEALSWTLLALQRDTPQEQSQQDLTRYNESQNIFTGCVNQQWLYPYENEDGWASVACCTLALKPVLLDCILKLLICTANKEAVRG